jgi:hypothetical protein
LRIWVQTGKKLWRHKLLVEELKVVLVEQIWVVEEQDREQHHRHSPVDHLKEEHHLKLVAKEQKEEHLHLKLVEHHLQRNN